MAEQQRGENMNIQRIVDAVISNLQTLPSTSARVNTESNNPNTRPFESPENELRSAFAIPRNAQAVNEGASLAQINAPSTSSSSIHDLSLSAGYSRYQNYSQVQVRPRRGKEQARSTTNGRFEKSGSQRGKSQQKRPAELAFKDVCLLPSPDYETVPRMRSKAELIGQGLYVDAWLFDKTSNEADLKRAIGDLFRERLVTDDGDEVGFEFVRSVGTEILPISVTEGQEVSGKVVKHITGSGPIYIRALKTLACAQNKESLCDDDETVAELMQTTITSFVRPQTGSERQREFHSSDDEELPNPLCKRPKIRNLPLTDVRSQLHAIFPNAGDNAIDEAVSTTSNVEEAVDSLLTPKGSAHNEADQLSNDEDDENVADLPLSFLSDDYWAKMSIPWKMEKIRSARLTGPKFKLLVDENEILTDAVAFYKSPCFDSTRPLRVSFNEQLAIDTGGVLREFFTTVKEKFISEGLFPMFEGPPERLLFNYEPSCHAAEIPKILGKIIAHSLIHGCGGFPHLAPSHYYYIATGEIQKAAAYASICDIYDVEKRDILEKLVSATSSDDLNDLNTSEYFLSITQESGLTCLCNVENKLRIAEAIVFYHVLVKKIVMLDSFCKGLETLGVLEEIRKNPLQFEAVFLHSENNLVASFVIERLSFLTEDVQIHTRLINFIRAATKQELENLLRFVSGVGSVPSTPITVDITESPEIFASTCLIKLCLPIMLKYKDQEFFNSSMQAAIRLEGKAFTSY